MASYVYLDDRFIELPYGFHDIVEFFNRDMFQPFRLIENLIRRSLGNILDVKLYASYFDPRKKMFIVEYMVRFEDRSRSRRIGIKIICAEDPRAALMEYYRAEKRGKVKKYLIGYPPFLSKD